MRPLNIVYLHTHDLGRYCRPMGYDIPSPNLMRLAEQGTLFRQCFASAPTCAPSRAALVTGQAPHCCGMLGLPTEHLGYRLNDYGCHLAGFLRGHGYQTALAGVQHVARLPFVDPYQVLPYDRFLNHTPTGGQLFSSAQTVPAAVAFLGESHEKPFFLSVGLLDPHRNNRGDERTFVESQQINEPADIDDRARYCRPWPHLPDDPVTRREMANFKIGVELMDSDIGRVLQALDAPALRDNTLVIFTTDHGPGVCEAKATLTDRGTGVVTIIRGPAGDGFADAMAFNGGKVVDGMIQHMDFYPTICELIGAEPPRWLQGKSILPLVRGETGQIHEAIFMEQTYHWSTTPRPLRAVRTPRYKYIRSYKRDQPRGVDPGPSQRFWAEHGYHQMRFPDEMLYDLIFDPNEANNLADDPAHAETRDALRATLQDWMRRTNDPLADGQIPAPPVASEQA